MGLRINTNVSSLSAQRSLRKVKSAQNQSLERLSSGNRINRAADDAAGLAISEKMKAQIRGTMQAKRNAGDGISMIQTAEGGLNEVSNILVRLRELSVQAASDTIGDNERKFSDMEFQQLSQEIDRIASSTEFNGKHLLNGGERVEGDGDEVSSQSIYDFQVGIHNDGKNDRISFNADATNATASALGVDSLNVASKDQAQNNLDAIDNAINKISGQRANLGALQNRLQSTINNLETKTENLSAANSRIRDTDVAAETAELTKNNILSQAGVSVLSQANQNGQAALRLIG
jgi:flagellin